MGGKSRLETAAQIRRAFSAVLAGRPGAPGAPGAHDPPGAPGAAEAAVIVRETPPAGRELSARIELLSPRQGEALSVPFRVQFHASGLNVSHTDIADAGVGHFRLVAQTKGGAVERIAFANGATEGWLKPPPGDYTLKLELVSNAPGGAVMAIGAPVAVKVLAR